MLDNSLARDAVKVEHVRMRVAHEQISSELIDLELVELKFIFNRCTYRAVIFNGNVRSFTGYHSPS